MTMDMSQFLETFYEESFEGLERMETGLLHLDPGAADIEVINDIFRAAHSIKGGAATFGLDQVASFTHLLETLLDQLRDGRRGVTEDLVDLLLRSVDCLREMLTASRADSTHDGDRATDLRARMSALLQQERAPTIAGPAKPATGPQTGWRIIFRPHTHLFQTGNDPVRILRELAELGAITVKADLGALPSFEQLNPEDSHLAWTIELSADVAREAINEVFAWVETDCNLDITPIASKAPAASPEPKTVVSGELLPERRQAPERRRTERRQAPASAESSSIRVNIDKVDAVIDLVGELVITQSMLSTLGEDFDMNRLHRLRDGLAQLERNTRELQESVMRMRMLPISFAFNRFPRMVHDLSAQLGKQIQLKMSGEGTELDKTVIERIGDPLVHLVRNSLDHGIEAPEERMAAGKSEVGTVWLDAYHKGGNIVIEIRDDGRGLNTEKIIRKAAERGLIAAEMQLTQSQINELIFLPGFSTAETVSSVSGRGVGMDVVRRNIHELGGTVDIASEPGRGSCFTVRLPLTLAILDGQSVDVGGETYIVPLVSIVESMQINGAMVSHVAGAGETFRLRNEYLPIVRLYDVFSVQPTSERLEDGLLVVVEGDGHRIGLFVDDLLGQQQVVIKSMETNYRRIEGISGATILGDGSVALILDIPGLIRLSQQRGSFQDLKRLKEIR